MAILCVLSTACGLNKNSTAGGFAIASESSLVKQAAKNGALAICRGDLQNARKFVFNDTDGPDGVDELVKATGNLFQFLPGGVQSISVECPNARKINSNTYEAEIIIKDPSGSLPMVVNVVRTDSGWQLSCASFFIAWMMASQYQR